MSEKVSSWHNSFCLIIMAAAQSPSAFLQFFDETFLNNIQFSNASRDYNYQARKTKRCEMIALSLLISKI